MTPTDSATPKAATPYLPGPLPSLELSRVSTSTSGTVVAIVSCLRLIAKIAGEGRILRRLLCGSGDSRVANSRWGLSRVAVDRARRGYAAAPQSSTTRAAGALPWHGQ